MYPNVAFWYSTMLKIKKFQIKIISDGKDTIANIKIVGGF